MVLYTYTFHIEHRRAHLIDSAVRQSAIGLLLAAKVSMSVPCLHDLKIFISHRIAVPHIQHMRKSYMPCFLQRSAPGKLQL